MPHLKITLSTSLGDKVIFDVTLAEIDRFRIR